MKKKIAGSVLAPAALGLIPAPLAGATDQMLRVPADIKPGRATT